MSTPYLRHNLPNLGEGGQRTLDAMKATPSAPAVLDRHEAALSDHEGRIQALEAAHDTPGTEPHPAAEDLA